MSGDRWRVETAVVGGESFLCFGGNTSKLHTCADVERAESIAVAKSLPLRRKCLLLETNVISCWTGKTGRCIRFDTSVYLNRYSRRDGDRAP